MKNKNVFFGLLTFLPMFAHCNKEKEKLSKPNILWVVIEDFSPQFIGCYGNTNARTPVIDKLANEGVRFTNVFATGTVCSASRSSIITGVKTYKTGTGHQRSDYPVPEFIKGFPFYLQEQGYYTTNNEKTDYNVANMEQFIKETWNESSGDAGWWSRKPGQPFFSVFNFGETHQSRTMQWPYEQYLETVYNRLSPDERIGDNEFEMPPFYRDSPEMRKQFARAYNSIRLTDKRIGELLDRLEKDNLKDSTIIIFYSDHGIGMPRGKTNGINLGYRVPFIIWFPEAYKHMSPWGTGGVVTNELINFTDLAPTLISLAGGDIPEYIDGRPFMGVKRSKPSDYLYLSSDRVSTGIDLVRSITNGKYIYSRNFMPFYPEIRHIEYGNTGEITRLMRKDLAGNRLNKLQKSLFEARPPEFLFDIETDLWETNNLATNPDFEAMLKQMRKLMKNEIIESRDVMLLPEYEINLISKSTTPYEFRLNDNNYPIEKIYEAASLSGMRGNNVTKKQIALLANPNKIIRYWAITGLRSQHPDDLQSYSGEIVNAMEDDYPPVAVTASVIAYDVFENKIAEEKLKLFCANEDKYISHMAMHYLIYVENKQPFINTAREVYRCSPHSDQYARHAAWCFLDMLGLIPIDPG
jgi:arylsulfatase A-like enzyme